MSTETTTMVKTLRYGKGYGGKLGHRCWIAEITGRDAKYGLSRVFLDPVEVEREHFNRPRTIIHFSYELHMDNLYEISSEGERRIVMCYADTDGDIRLAKISEERIRIWVDALAAGLSPREARLKSKKETKKS